MKLALIGDVHGFFDDFDVEYFNQSDYDFILFTGDVPDFFHLSNKAYKKIALLKKNVFMQWGNHDGFSFLEVVGELFGWSYFKVDPSKIPVIKKRLDTLKKQLGSNVISGGYKATLLTENCALFIVRPHSIGGSRLGYKEILQDLYNVKDFQDSFNKMKNILDHFKTEFPKVDTLIFLGHNGPYGLSNDPRDVWGCDFKPELGDFGDIDFRQIIDYAKQKGFYVPLVVAGHMHHRLSKKTEKYLRKKQEDLQNYRERQSITQKDNTYYVNPAKVPRIIKQNGVVLHYHVFVEISQHNVLKIEEKYVKKQIV